MIDTVPFPEQTHAASGAGRERYARLDVLLQQVIAQARALNIPISDRIQPHVRINRPRGASAHALPTSGTGRS